MRKQQKRKRGKHSFLFLVANSPSKPHPYTSPLSGSQCRRMAKPDGMSVDDVISHRVWHTSFPHSRVSFLLRSHTCYG